MYLRNMPQGASSQDSGLKDYIPTVYLLLFIYICHSDTQVAFLEHEIYVFSLRIYTCMTCYKFSKKRVKDEQGLRGEGKVGTSVCNIKKINSFCYCFTASAF
jgi:hypothetical protein